VTIVSEVSERTLDVIKAAILAAPLPLVFWVPPSNVSGRTLALIAVAMMAWPFLVFWLTADYFPRAFSAWMLVAFVCLGISFLLIDRLGGNVIVAIGMAAFGKALWECRREPDEPPSPSDGQKDSP
jgi:hypothetical protein